MDFYSVIKQRRSIRKYKPDPFPQDMLERILEAARIAPTAVSRQPFQFVVVKNPKKHLAEIIRQKWVLEAPVVIIAFAKPEEAWQRSWDDKNYAFVDTTIAMDHLILAATAEGLGTCWVAANDPEKLKDLLPEQKSLHFVALTPLGYPDEEPEERPRKEFTEFIIRINE